MDILTAFDGLFMRADLAMDGALLAQERGLNTAIAISLFSDGPLGPDDEIPSGDESPNGWWGDVVAPAAAADDAPWRTGSRLRLINREKQTDETARRAVTYCREALEWMTRLGVASQVTVSAEWVARGVLGIVITVYRPAAAPERFAYLWNVADNLVSAWKDAA